MTVFEQDDEQKTMKEINTIQGDLSLGQYDIEIMAGTEVPRSPQERSQIYQWAWQDGRILPAGITGIRLLLEALDFPNRHAIIEQLEDDQQKKSNIPIQPPVKDISVGFKDLPLPAQAEWLFKNGFINSAHDIEAQWLQQCHAQGLSAAPVLPPPPQQQQQGV
jgi:hypothetical protein